MKKTITVCDRCEQEIRDRRTMAAVTLGTGGRKTNGQTLDLCGGCGRELRAWLKA